MSLTNILCNIKHVAGYKQLDEEKLKFMRNVGLII